MRWIWWIVLSAGKVRLHSSELDNVYHQHHLKLWSVVGDESALQIADSNSNAFLFFLSELNWFQVYYIMIILDWTIVTTRCCILHFHICFCLMIGFPGRGLIQIDNCFTKKCNTLLEKINTSESLLKLQTLINLKSAC